MGNGRIGFTVAEVLMSMVVGGVVILIVSSIGVRETQFATGMSGLLTAAATVQETATIFSLDLRAADPLQGDIPPGEARDTSIQFRSTIATSIVCDTVGGALVLSPSVQPFGSTVSAPLANDSVWLLVADSSEHWEPHVITWVSTTASGQCAAGAPILGGAALAARRPMIGVTPLIPGSGLGMPIRITRPLRYSLYKSSDGLWYFGQRDWNSSTQRLNSIQPVAGPLLPPAQAGFALTYADSGGGAIPSASLNTRAIASMRITARAQTTRVVEIPGFATRPGGFRVDSATAVVAFRSK